MLCYSHKSRAFRKNRTILRRPYVDRPAAGIIVRFLINDLDIVGCSVKFMYYLKFHGTRTAIGTVMRGKWPTMPGRRPAGVCTHRTGTGRCLFKIYIVRFQSYDVWQASGTFKSILTNRLMTARAPLRSEVFLQKYCIYKDISFLKTKNINTNNIFRLSSWGWLTCNEQVLLHFLQSWASVVFITITRRVWLNLSYFNNLFLFRNGGEFL